MWYVLILFTFHALSNLSAESVCRAPHDTTICAETARKMWYFDNSTNKCVSYVGCGTGLNDFGSAKCCKDSCPYGSN
uniref:Putative kunitz n=1 Tax=Ixodes ricinus TaxID=34613 RepID=A0A6B0TZZ1_IXORI